MTVVLVLPQVFGLKVIVKLGVLRALEVGTVWINTYKNSRLVHRLVALKTVGSGAKRPFGHFIVHATKEYLYGAE